MFRVAICDDNKELCNTVENVIMNQRVIDSEMTTEVFYEWDRNGSCIKGYSER